MSTSLPRGVRDLLPDAAARLAELTARLHRAFAAHGYRRVVVPTLERFDVVERGLVGSSRETVVRFVEPGTGDLVALRPDITPQIARMFAARPDALPAPARLCYDGPVLRIRESRAGRPREVYQAGVELLGAAGAAADAEVIALASEALVAAGLAFPVRARLDLGHARFAPAILDAALLTPTARGRAEAALGRKDAGALEAIAAQATGGDRSTRAARRALPRLAEIYGDRALGRARELAADVVGAAPALAELEALLPLLHAAGAPVPAIDLGEVRGLGYYTGITFAVYAPGAGAPVLTGGRYDGLLERFGRPSPAVGLAVDLEFLAAALPEGDGAAPEAGSRSILLAQGQLPAAMLLAAGRALRQRGRDVGLIFDDRGGDALLAYARASGYGAVLVPEDPAAAALTWTGVATGVSRRISFDAL